MLYMKIIAVYFHNCTKQLSKLCGQNVELLKVKLVVYVLNTGIQSFKSLLYKTVI
jgi:hypothetical protein